MHTSFTHMHVEPVLASGAVKVTPAHDHDDFEVGRRHKLKMTTILAEDGTLVNVPEEFQVFNLLCCYIMLLHYREKVVLVAAINVIVQWGCTLLFDYSQSTLI